MSEQSSAPAGPTEDDGVETTEEPVASARTTLPGLGDKPSIGEVAAWLRQAADERMRLAAEANPAAAAAPVAEAEPAVEAEDVQVEAAVDAEDVPVEAAVEAEDLQVDAADVPVEAAVEAEDVPVEAEDVPVEAAVEAEDVPVEAAVEAEDLPVEAKDVQVEAEEVPVDAADVPVEAAVDAEDVQAEDVQVEAEDVPVEAAVVPVDAAVEAEDTDPAPEVVPAPDAVFAPPDEPDDPLPSPAVDHGEAATDETDETDVLTQGPPPGEGIVEEGAVATAGAYPDLDALEAELATRPTPVVTIGPDPQPDPEPHPEPDPQPEPDLLPATGVQADDEDADERRLTVPRAGLFTLPDELPATPAPLGTVLGVPAIVIPAEELPSDRIDPATVVIDAPPAASPVAPFDLDAEEIADEDATADETEVAAEAVPPARRRTRVRYPRGQLTERIGLLARLRAILGVTLIALVLGVLLAATIGGFLLFLFLAGRSAISG